MKDRFTGQNRQNLISALLEQSVVEHDKNLAESLADVGKVVGFASGDSLTRQGDTTDEAFFLITGTVKVFVNNRDVGRRGRNDLIGEMAAMDPVERRSATVIAQDEVVALCVDAESFRRLTDQHPRLWRPIARILADRLRQRERFHRPKNDIPIMFVGSSVEGLEAARAIDSAFKHDENLVVRLWSGDVFGPSRTPLEDLMEQVAQADFAALVFGPDDRIVSRDGKPEAAPRDNIIFELGLFMGRLKPERVFLVRESRSDVKIPSDLLGLQPVEYKCKTGCSVGDAVYTACNEIRDATRKLGAI